MPLIRSNQGHFFIDNTMHIYRNAKCDGEAVTEGTGARNLAIQFKLEGGGIYCGAV